MASWKWPNVLNRMLDDIPGINILLNALLKQDVTGTTDVPAGAKQWVDTPNGKQFQVFNGQSWSSVGKLDHDAASVDGYDASPTALKNTIPVRDANGDLPGNITGNAKTATKAGALSAVNPVEMGGTGGNTAALARQNLGVPPTDHSSTGTDYGLGNATEYGHNKLSDATDSDLGTDGGTAATPLAVKMAKAEAMTAASAALTAFAETQSAKDAEQDEAIAKKVSKVNDREPDANGNVDVGGMPLGTAFPYTGKDVPAGTLRADGTTYTNMRASFPEFYEWVVASGLTVLLADYTLVEGSCGAYGLDTSTGTVRMPTLASGVFGTVTAGQYGQAVQAGLPGIMGKFDPAIIPGHADYCEGAFYATNNRPNDGAHRIASTEVTGPWGFGFDASRSSAIFGRSDTVTPAHVKYPWVIVVYNAAVPPSVAQAGEFVELLDGKVDREGDSIEWLKFPDGQIFAETDPAIRGTVLEGARGDASSGYGAMIAPRHALAVNNPGGIDLLTRHPDGTFGVIGAMFRDGRWIWKGRNVVLSINGAFADDAGNVQLIEFHSDPLVWWKRYSNGWIEQGGIIYASGNDYDIVTFPIKFQSIPARGDFQMGIRDGAYPAGFYRMTTFADSMTQTTMNVFAKTGDNRIMSVTGFWSAYGF